MNYKILIIACCISTQAFALNTTVKNLLSLSAGTALALAGHQLLEHVTTTMHELGHAVANKVITGDPIEISVKRTGGLLGSICPWQGLSRFRTNLNEKPFKHAARIAAGPLAGIMTAQLQFYLLTRLQASLEGKKDYSASPWSFLKNVHAESFKTTTFMKNEKKLPEVSTLSVAISVLKFLRCSRMIGEAAYGFLPFGIQNFASASWSRTHWRWTRPLGSIITKRKSRPVPCVEQ